MFKIQKIYRFEMGHILRKAYSNECKQFHGHSYKMGVILQSDKLDAFDMVMDFKKLNEIVKPIIAEFDHKCLIQENKQITKAEMLKLIKFGMVFVDFNPTGEQLAKYFYERITEALENKFIIEISLWETETSCISYSNHNERFE